MEKKMVNAVETNPKTLNRLDRHFQGVTARPYLQGLNVGPHLVGESVSREKKGCR